MHITEADIRDPQIEALMRTHLARSRAETAPGSAHALELHALAAPDIAFWALWDADGLIGFGALRQLTQEFGEVKSMHTAEAKRRTGAGSAMLRHIIAEARARGMARLSLETGSWPYFEPARALYRKHGFVECPPFGAYTLDPNSVFMTLDLRVALQP